MEVEDKLRKLVVLKDKLSDCRKTQIDIEMQIDRLRSQIARLEADIKRDVLALGRDVETDVAHAVYQAAMIWDTEALDSYATEHPELLKFKRNLEPSVSIRLLTAVEQEGEVGY